MKKKKSSTRSSAPSGRRTPKSVDDYIERLPEAAFTALSEIREVVRSVVPPDAVEVISYGIPAFKRKKVLVWYAGFAKHCSLFPTAAVIEAFEDELKGFTISKGTVQFPLDKPLPIALIKRMVKARVAQSEGPKR